MKQLLGIFLLAAVVFVSCSTGAAGNNNSSNSNNSNNSTITSSTLPNSGATTTPTTLSGIFSALSGIPQSDSVAVDLQGSLQSLGNSVSSSASIARANANPIASALVKTLKTFSSLKGSAKSLNSDITTQFTNLGTAISNFVNTPVADPLTASNGTISLSGDSLSQYFTLTTATGALTASVITTDGSELNTSTMGNFKSATGSASLALQVDLKNPPSSSAFKYFTLQVNTGLTASLGATTVSGQVKPANLAFNYNAQSVLVAISFNNSGTGGKIILTINLPAYSNTIADPSNFTLTASSVSSSVAPSPTIVLTVYKDDGTTTYTKTWTDWSTFQSDINSVSST